MKSNYRVYAVGNFPQDLRDRLASIHASAILRSKQESTPSNIRGAESENRSKRRGLKQILEICAKLHVDSARIKVSKPEFQKIELQIKDIAIKQLMNKKESG